MQAAGPAARHYNPALRPVMSLLRQLTGASGPDPRLGAEAGIQTRTAPACARDTFGAGIIVNAVVRAGVRALESLPPVKGFMFDLDGTLLLSDRSLGGYEVLPGAVEVLSALQGARDTVRRAHQRQRLSAGGAGGAPARAGSAGRGRPDAYALQRGRGAHVAQWCEASAGAGQPRRWACAERSGNRNGVRRRAHARSEVDAVYVGWHPECNMKDIEAACQAIWAGAKLYVASDVPFFATRQGRTMGYSYAIVGAIRRMTKAPIDPHRQTLTARAALSSRRSWEFRCAASASSATIRPWRSSWRGGAVQPPSA